MKFTDKTVQSWLQSYKDTAHFSDRIVTVKIKLKSCSILNRYFKGMVDHSTNLMWPANQSGTVRINRVQCYHFYNVLWLDQFRLLDPNLILAFSDTTLWNPELQGNIEKERNVLLVSFCCFTDKARLHDGVEIFSGLCLQFGVHSE